MTKIPEQIQEKHSITRRQFLRSTARAGVAAAAAPVLTAGWAGEARSADVRTAFGSYGLELDGVFAGPLTSFSGGNVVSDVIALKPGPDSIRRKRLGQARVEPITIEAGLPMTKPFYEWIKSSIEPSPRFLRKNGAIIVVDGDRRERRRLSFSNALVSAVQFPSCDASARQPARLSVTFAPGTVALTAGSGASSATQFGRLPSHGLVSSAYRLRIKGLETATARVTRIEPIKVSVATVAAPAGELRDYERLPSTVDVGNFAISVDDGVLAPVYAWHEDFVVRGNAGPDRERVGVLEYLAADGRSALLTLNLFGLGIFRIGQDATASQDSRATAFSKVEMYCQTIGVDFGGDLKA